MDGEAEKGPKSIEVVVFQACRKLKKRTRGRERGIEWGGQKDREDKGGEGRPLGKFL